jgi:tetratricopeptide (TPR) repeat protein
VVSVLTNMAAAQTRLGRGAEALVTGQRALEVSLAIHGPDHPSVVDCRAMIAGSLVNMGRHAEAVPRLEEALAGLRRIHGDRHPDVAGMLQNLGWSHAQLGHAAESIAALTEAVGIFRDTRGPRHPVTAVALHTLAQAHALAGNIDDARARYREALAVVEPLPEEARRTAYVLSKLGSLELEFGEVETALELCERSVALLADAKGDGDLADARGCVAGASWRLGRDHARAIELVREARDELAGSGSRPRAVARIDAWLEQAAPGGPPPPSLHDIVTDDG